MTTETHAPPGRGLRPLLSLRKHLRASLVVALLLVLVGLPLVWVKGKSYFAAESVFQVAPAYQKNLSADKELEFQSNSQYREFVNHLSRTVLRYDVVDQALTRLNTAGTEACRPGESRRKCIERLQRAVFVYAIPDTYMVRVGLQADERVLVDKIVNAIMDVFLEVTRSEQIYGSEERIGVLNQRSQTLRGEVTALEQQRATLAGKLSLTTFGENTANPYDLMLAQAREKLVLAGIERTQAQAMLDAFNRQRETPLAAGRSVMEMRLQDNGLQALRNEVVKRSEELDRSMSGLEERHPARKPAASEQETINRRLATRESDFEQAASGNVRLRLTSSLQQTRQVEQELAARVRDLEGQATGFAASFRDAVRISGEIKKREQELNELRDRLNYMSTERHAIGFVRLVSRALPAETPQGIGKFKLLLLLLAAAGVVMLGLPTLIDLLDRRVLTVSDAERALGIESAGWLVQVHDEATRMLGRDQIRRFASTLLRNRQRGAAAVFGFTSVRIGGGATALVLDVARTLSQLGSRVLVVDANSLSMHSPLHSDAPGLTEVLAGRAEPLAVVREHLHGQEALALAPYGQLREAGIQHLDRLRAAFARWSEHYDLILVDVPPILPSADAELLIDVIGQVFLVVEVEAVRKSEVSRARAQLQKMSPEAVGLLVNKVPLEAGGAELKSQMVETITGGRFAAFMSLPLANLQWQLLRAHWTKFVTRS